VSSWRPVQAHVSDNSSTTRIRLLCGLAVPTLFVVSALANPPAGILVFGIYTCIAWTLLGSVVKHGVLPPARA
jgi:hypothetical protein